VELDKRPMLQCIEEHLLTKEARAQAMGLLIRGLVLGSRSKGYDSRMRVAVKRLARDLGLDFARDLVPYERAISAELSKPLPVASQTADRGWTASRVAQVSGAAVLGGVALALTGGLAAPALGAVLGSMGAGLGLTGTAAATSAFLASSGGAAMVSVLFGATGAGLGGYKMKRRTASLEEFFVLPVQADTTRVPGAELSVSMGLSGWLPDESPGRFCRFWGEAFVRVRGADRLCVVYDRTELVEYGDALDSLLANQALGMVYNEAAKHALGGAIVAAFALPSMLVQAMSIVDNPFAVARARCLAAGEELALALEADRHGRRPVSLVGFGFGALAAFRCTQVLAAHAKYGVLEDVVLMGMPLAGGNQSAWEAVRGVVAGKLVNAYCPEDWTLSVLFRLQSRFPAGVAPVNVQGVRDVAIAFSHFDLGANPAHIAAVLEEVL
jgi:hypothetical protein